MAATYIRRELLRIAAVGGTSAIVAGCAPAAAPRGAKVPGDVTPESALRILMDGNARYASGQMTSFDEDLELSSAPHPGLLRSPTLPVEGEGD